MDLPGLRATTEPPPFFDGLVASKLIVLNCCAGRGFTELFALIVNDLTLGTAGLSEFMRLGAT